MKFYNASFLLSDLTWFYSRLDIHFVPVSISRYSLRSISTNWFISSSYLNRSLDHFYYLLRSFRTPWRLSALNKKTLIKFSWKFTLQDSKQASNPTRPGTALPRFVWSAFSDAFPQKLLLPIRNCAQ